MAFTIDSMERGLNKNPFIPSFIKSKLSQTSLHNTGNPQDIASQITFGYPSKRDGKINKSAS